MSAGIKDPLKVRLVITTDCGYGFDGVVAIDDVATIMRFSAECITSLPMALVASKSPTNIEESKPKETTPCP